MRPLFLSHGYGNVFRFLPVLSSVPFLGLQNLSRTEERSSQNRFYIKLWVSYVKVHVALAPHFWALSTAPPPPPHCPFSQVPSALVLRLKLYQSLSKPFWTRPSNTNASLCTTDLPELTHLHHIPVLYSLLSTKIFRILMRTTLISIVKGPWRMPLMSIK